MRIDRESRIWETVQVRICSAINGKPKAPTKSMTVYDSSVKEVYSIVRFAIEKKCKEPGK